MNILVVGGGGREHAIAWKLRQSPRVDRLFVAPGNAGTARLGTNLNIAPTDVNALAEAARSLGIDLTVVGPEAPLAEGIVDRFQELGLPIFGPTRAAARIESSKAFAKHLMNNYGIPTAQGRVFSDCATAKRYVEQAPLPLVVKADGLAAGKGVTVCRRREEAVKAIHDAMERKVFGAAGERVLIEECLEGPEVSVFAFTDGVHLSPLVAACDYKRVFDGDRGPNTGGMGSYSPPEFWTPALAQQVLTTIMEPAVQAMAAEGCPYRGVLYGGLMLTTDGPKVLEFNCRLGDPECQVIMPRLTTDLVEVIFATLNGTLERCPVEWENGPCVGVVIASGGYPGEYKKGYAIRGLQNLEQELVVFHSGTKLLEDGISGKSTVATDGGRVLTVAALGRSLREARSKVYRGLQRLSFEEMHYRTDIAARAIGEG
ncbi:MAG: phosphoribosylamine--glycine ligase [Chloroflexi bacterium]|nr:phosphoribosylamine--glycine ligase [Chloroflexota bacterium]